jgi:hypothetical protein
VIPGPPSAIPHGSSSVGWTGPPAHPHRRIVVEGHIFAIKSGRERDHIKLRKCDVVDVPDTVVVPVVVAETRQQAIEKASAELLGSGPGVPR